MKRLAVTAIALLSVGLSACSEAELREGFDKAKGIAAERAAVTAAETLRLMIIQEAPKRTLPTASTALITEIVKGLPGTSVTLVDANADGLHDAPTITVSSLGASACLTLPVDTSKGETRPGACV